MSNILQSLDYRLTYADTDPLGIVYYAAYYPWMERTYNEWLIQTGFTNDETGRRFGIHSVMRASSCDYRVPGVLFDALTCRMRLSRAGTTSYTLTFDMVRRADDMVLAIGLLTLVMVDRDGKPAAVPAEFLAWLEGRTSAST